MNVYNAEASKPEGVQVATLKKKWCKHEIHASLTTSSGEMHPEITSEIQIWLPYRYSGAQGWGKLAEIVQSAPPCLPLLGTNTRIVSVQMQKNFFEQMHFFSSKMQNILAEIMQCAVVHIPPSHL